MSRGPFRKLVVVDFSEAFPVAWLERLQELEVYSKVLRRGEHRTRAMLDSPERASAFADLLTVDVRGSVLEASDSPRAGSVSGHVTIFHELQRAGYATSFIGAFGLRGDAADAEAVLRGAGVDDSPRADATLSRESSEVCDIQLLRQAHGVVSAWTSGRHALFVSLRGPVELVASAAWDAVPDAPRSRSERLCRECGVGGAGRARAACDTDRYMSIVDGLLCSLHELLYGGDHSDTVFFLTASHLVDDGGAAPRHATHEFRFVHTFALFGGLGASRGVCDEAVALRTLLHDLARACVRGVDPEPPAPPRHHVSYKFAPWDLVGWRTEGAGLHAMFDYAFLHVGVWLRDAAAEHWVVCFLSLRMLMESTFPEARLDDSDLSEALRLLASTGAWRTPDTDRVARSRVSVEVLRDATGAPGGACAWEAFDGRDALRDALRADMAVVDLAFAAADVARFLYEETVAEAVAGTCGDACDHGASAPRPRTRILDATGRVRLTLVGLFDVESLRAMAARGASALGESGGSIALALDGDRVRVAEWELQEDTLAIGASLVALVVGSPVRVADPVESKLAAAAHVQIANLSERGATVRVDTASGRAPYEGVAPEEVPRAPVDVVRDAVVSVAGKEAPRAAAPVRPASTAARRVSHGAGAGSARRLESERKKRREMK